MKIWYRLSVLTVMFSGLLFVGSVMADGPFGQIQKGTDAKHTPVIEAPDKVKAGVAFQVTVKVGEKMHPSDIGHFVRWIELYAGEVQVARVNLTPTLTQPVVTFNLTLNESTILRVLSAPNHSAAWEASKKVTVSP